MRSGFDNHSGIWGNPYYEENPPPDLSPAVWKQLTFQPGPALVALNPEAMGEAPGTLHRYAGEDFDPALFRLEPGVWDHEHCEVCNYSINPGFRYWEDPDGRCLCDACYEHYVAPP